MVNKFVFALASVVLTGAAFAAPIGKITVLNGNVQIKTASGWSPAKLSQNVDSDMVIQTSYSGSVVIHFHNGTQVKINKNTLANLKSMGGQGQTMELRQGNISAFVMKKSDAEKNNFVVRTPTVVAGVRGTFIKVQQRGDDFQNETLVGEAYVAPIESSGEYSYSGL